jgi:hypothetical protein
VRPLAAGLVALAFVGSYRTAAAAELHWKAPGECPDSRDVTEEVGRLLGRALASVNQADFDVEVVHDTKDDWTLTLRRAERATGEQRSRQFHGKTCSDVADAAVVAVALAVQGEESATTGGPAEPKVVDRQPPIDEGAHTGPSPEPPKKPAIRAIAALAGVVDLGALPAAAPGFELSASGAYERFVLSAVGGLFAPQTTSSPAGGGGRFGLWFAGLLACFEQPTRGFLTTGCAGVELGQMSGEGVNVSHSREEVAFWQAFRLEVGVSLPLTTGVSVLVRVGAAVPFSRPEFVLDGADVVHRPAAVTGRGLLGVEFRP